jgi:hypothetical protein
MLGVIDVVTHVELSNPQLSANTLLQLVTKALPGSPPPEFEVIVDYKGMKRPDPAEKGIGLWEIYEWQVHTYAYLRSLLTTKAIIAGVLIYLNELVPTKTDFYALRRALKENPTDARLPAPGTSDEQLLRNWRPKYKDDEPPLLSLDFRLSRAVRVIPITKETIANSLNQFDGTVARIEKCVAAEAKSGVLISSWERNPSHDPTCEACDSNTWCPDHSGATQPQLPGRKP